MKAVVVDDRADARDGRVWWLLKAGADVVGLSFLEALATDRTWHDVDLAVLDGRDDRRSTAVTIPNPDGEATTVHDRFLGVRVAEAIRRTRSPEQTRIVVVSAFARENEYLARRFWEAGADAVYSLDELPDAAPFVSSVLESLRSPATDDTFPPSPFRRPSPRATHRNAPLSAAIALMEASPAGRDLLFCLPPSESTGSPHHLRTLRARLGDALGIREYTGGPRDRHPSKQTLSRRLRLALGLHPDDSL